MSVEITLKEFVRTALALALEAEPDYVYKKQIGANPNADGIYPSGCLYVRDGEASCYIGQILNHLGVSVDELSKHEEEGAQHMLERLEGDNVIIVQDTDEFERIQRFASALQDKQDNAETWKDAYIHATFFIV